MCGQQTGKGSKTPFVFGCVCVYQGRSLRESTLRRAQRRSFTPASFMEEDLVDFPDELDTSFFARVSRKRFFYVAMY